MRDKTHRFFFVLDVIDRVLHAADGILLLRFSVYFITELGN